MYHNINISWSNFCRGLNVITNWDENIIAKPSYLTNCFNPHK